MTYVRGLLVGLLVVGGALAGGDDEKKALEPFQGKWKITRSIHGGKPAPEEKRAKAEVFFEGDNIVISETGVNAQERKETAHFKIDTTKTPHAMDLIPEKGTDKKTVRGIYRFDDKGKRLTIAFAHSGDG